MVRRPPWISENAAPDVFPHPSQALTDPDGLLALGGDLSPQRLVCAYRAGIFPWYSEGEPILWWSPDPRALLDPQRVRISRSLKKILRQERYQLAVDTDFAGVIHACSLPRSYHDGTWITQDMMAAYNRLFQLGIAHSVECWQGEELVGGLYGIALGRVFFGESMFSRARDASKVALVNLCRMGFDLIDCQVVGDFVVQMGAQAVPRSRFLQLLDRYCDQQGPRFCLDSLDGGE